MSIKLTKIVLSLTYEIRSFTFQQWGVSERLCSECRKVMRVVQREVGVPFRGRRSEGRREWSSEMSEENLATKSSNNHVMSQLIFDDPQNVEKVNGPWSQIRSQFSPCNEIHLLILWALIVNIPSSNFKMKFFLRKMVFLAFFS